MDVGYSNETHTLSHFFLFSFAFFPLLPTFCIFIFFSFNSLSFSSYFFTFFFPFSFVFLPFFSSYILHFFALLIRFSSFLFPHTFSFCFLIDLFPFFSFFHSNLFLLFHYRFVFLPSFFPRWFYFVL